MYSPNNKKGVDQLMFGRNTLNNDQYIYLRK